MARYSEDHDPVIWTMCVGAAIVTTWLSGSLIGTTDAAHTPSTGRMYGAFLGGILLSFLVGYIFAKIALRLVGHTPMVGRGGFFIGVGVVIALTAILESHAKDAETRRLADERTPPGTPNVVAPRPCSDEVQGSTGR